MPALTIPNIYKPHNLLSLIFVSPTFLQPVCWSCRKFSVSVVVNREVGGGGSLEMRLLVKLTQSHMNINSRPCDPPFCPSSLRKWPPRHRLYSGCVSFSRSRGCCSHLHFTRELSFGTSNAHPVDMHRIPHTHTHTFPRLVSNQRPMNASL